MSSETRRVTGSTIDRELANVSVTLSYPQEGGNVSPEIRSLTLLVGLFGAGEGNGSRRALSAPSSPSRLRLDGPSSRGVDGSVGVDRDSRTKETKNKT